MELHHLVKTKVPKLVVTSLGPMLEYQQAKLFRLIEPYLERIRRDPVVRSAKIEAAVIKLRAGREHSQLGRLSRRQMQDENLKEKG